MASKILFATLISMAAAQTTLSIPWIGVDPDIGSMVLDDIQASVVAANPTATTLSLGCAPSQECGLFPAETLIYGPSTYNIYMGDPSPDSDFTGTMDCVIAKSAVCKESAAGTEANFPGSSTTTYEAESVGTFGVLVTAGMDKLNVKAAATAAASVTSEAAATGSGVSGSMATITSAASTKAAAAASGSASVSASASAANISGYVEKVGAAGRNAVGVLGVAAGVLGLLL
jgi:hypothetical protein